MLAAYVGAVDRHNPLAGLEVGEQPEPRLREGWALVEVHAATLNHHDLWTLRGVSSRPVRPPQVLGCDAAGVVAAYLGEPPPGAPRVGARVVVHAVVGCGHCAACLRGEETLCNEMAMLSEGDLGGALCHFVQVPARNLVELPDTVRAGTAACLPTAYLTAYRMLFTRGGARPGGSVLVHGATGGVSTAAITLARASGMQVLATSRSEEGRRFAMELGAVDAMPADRDAAKRVLSCTGGEGVDVVIETVGEPTWEVSIRAVRRGGVIAVAGATGGPDPSAHLNHVFWRQFSIAGTTMGTRDELARLVGLCAQGALRPVIDRELPLRDVRGLFERMAAGEQRGKLLVRPQD